MCSDGYICLLNLMEGRGCFTIDLAYENNLQKISIAVTADTDMMDKETIVKESSVNVVFAVDDAYTEPFLISILSTLCNTDLDVRFYIISTQGKANLDKTVKILEALGISCTIKTKTDVDVYYAKMFGVREGYTLPAHYYRLFAPDLFPEVQRALYLDSDLVVRADVGLMWSIDLNGYILAAVADPCFLGADEAEFRAAYGGRYFNSGVLLLDFRLWRTENVTSKVFGWIVKYNETDQLGIWRQCWEQSPLNMVLKGKWLDLSPTWNFTIRTLPDYALSYGLTAAEFSLISADPGIFHFLDIQKPWRPEFAHLNRFFDEYHRYRRMIQRFDTWPTVPVTARLGA